MGDANSFEFVNNIVLVGDEAVKADVSYGFADFRNATFANNVYWAANSTSAAVLQKDVSGRVREWVGGCVVRGGVR